MDDDTSRVGRRRVFYIPGYDPFPPRRYRELYRREAAEQARLSGYEVELIAEHERLDGYGWRVEGRMENDATRALIEVLVWSDIVRDSMSNSIPATYWQLLRTAWIYISTGTLRRLTWLRKGPVIAALYPVGMLLGQLLLAVIAFWAAATVAGWAFGWIEGLIWPDQISTPLLWPGIGVSLAVGLGAGYLLLDWFRAQDGRLFAYYLMHDYAFAARNWGAYPLPLEVRMEEFANRIAEALEGEADEVLVVGHSSGAILAVTILADLIRSGRVSEDGPELSLLTLGQVIPMMSFLPKATRLRGDLAYLAQRDELAWVDVSAPGDGCAFALCDPVAVSGVAPSGALWPLVLSAAFSNTLRAQTWKALKRRYFRLHFQYLCAFDNLEGGPADYDYFRITAGPKTLSDRFVGRAPSNSRIDVAASKYTSVER